MKRYVLVLLAALIAALAVVGCDKAARPVTPPPAAPPTATTIAGQSTEDGAPITEGDVTQMTINGMTVIVKRVSGAELVAAQLYVKGGARNWGAVDAGVEQMAVSVATSGGAGKLDKDAFARRLAALGSDLGASSGNDFSVFALKALKPKLDETFAMLCDTFLDPALPPTEVELKRQGMLSNLRHEQESPDARLNLLVHRSLFKGHPYEHRAAGTLESVARITRTQLEAHLAKLREASRLVLVVVGDVDAAHVGELARTKLGALPRGNYRDAPMPALAFGKSSVQVTSAALPTNYVKGTFTAPGWKDPDFYAAMVAMEHLGHRMFEEVRTKRNLSYAPKAGFFWGGAIPLGQLYVTAVDPNTTIKVMFDEVRKLQGQRLSDSELSSAKATFLTDSLMATETTDGQASSLARAQIFAGDWRVQVELLERVKAVTAEQVLAFAKTIAHLQFQVMGDGKIDTTLFGSL